jgi:Plant ATP synthase F0
MPQLDILSYFSQFIFLLISFLSIYYFVITFILPSTVTAAKLRAKFNSHLTKSQDNQSPLAADSDSLAVQVIELPLDSLTLLALKELAQKSVATTTVEEFNAIHKNGKYTMTSALMLHYMNTLATKKRLVSEQLTLV